MTGSYGIVSVGVVVPLNHSSFLSSFLRPFCFACCQTFAHTLVLSCEYKHRIHTKLRMCNDARSEIPDEMGYHIARTNK